MIKRRLNTLQANDLPPKVSFELVHRSNKLACRSLLCHRTSRKYFRSFFLGFKGMGDVKIVEHWTHNTTSCKLREDVTSSSSKELEHDHIEIFLRNTITLHAITNYDTQTPQDILCPIIGNFGRH